jgi:hypothetical protein
MSLVRLCGDGEQRREGEEECKEEFHCGCWVQTWELSGGGVVCGVFVVWSSVV